MLSIFLSYIYVAILAFSYGNAFFWLVNKKLGYEVKKLSSVLWAGIAIITTYAQVYSLFSGVGLAANLILILGSIALNICLRSELASRLKNRLTIADYIWLLIFLIIFSYAASRGYNHYDTGLYHAQAIRWIEEYGVVKGLGLLHFRLAYNSSAFAVSALFSFHFLPIKESLHAMAGFFTMLLAMEIPMMFRNIRNKRFTATDLLRVGVFYYISLIFDDIVSPASDYFVMSAVFFIVLSFAELVEKEEGDAVPYSLLCVFGVVAGTIKFSACFIVLLTIYPVILMIKKGQAGHIFIYLVLGLGVIAPFLIRNIIISGRLLYPMTVFDFFNVDWKISEELAMHDRMDITAWARGIPNTAGYYMSLNEWFPPYFAGLSIMNKALFALDALGGPGLIVMTIVSFIKKDRKNASWLFLTVIVYINLAVWFMSAPLVRYGYVYLISPCILVFGKILENKKITRLAMLAFGCLFVLWKGYEMLSYSWEARIAPYYIYGQPYEKFEVYEVRMGAETFYLPANADQTGYDYFPATIGLNCELRGESLKDGFTNIR